MHKRIMAVSHSKLDYGFEVLSRHGETAGTVVEEDFGDLDSTNLGSLTEY